MTGSVDPYPHGRVSSISLQRSCSSQSSPAFGRSEPLSSVLLSKLNLNKRLCKWDSILVECVIVAPVAPRCDLISTAEILTVETQK